MSDFKTVVEWALKYYDLGWSIIRVQPKSKKALGEWKQFQTERAAREQIQEWFTDSPKAGIAVVLGKVSNLICVDIDSEAGAEYLIKNGVVLDDTGTSVQKSPGGWHYFYQYQENTEIKNVNFRGGEIKSDGTYIILSPSIHPSGSQYSWILEPFDGIAEAPESLVKFANKNHCQSEAANTDQNNGSHDWQTLIKGHVPIGNRNNTLMSYAGYLRQYGIGKKGLTQLLNIVNHLCEEPLPNNELERIADSACKFEATTDWHFQPLSEVIAEAEDLTWIVRNWLSPGHLTLLTGSPKIGKSVLALNLMIALGRGGKFLGQDVPKKRVGFICAEDGKPILRDRIMKMGTVTDNQFVHLGGKILDPATILSLHTVIIERNLEVLVIDPFLRMHNLKEDSAGIARPIYMVSELARSTGVAVLLIHHDRKSGGEFGSQIRGSSAILGAVDLSISMKRFSGPGYLMQVETIGRICTETDPFVIEGHKEDLIWSLKGRKTEIEVADVQAKILDAINAGCVKLAEIAKFAEIPDATCYRRLKKLEKLSRISPLKGGGWELR